MDAFTARGYWIVRKQLKSLTHWRTQACVWLAVGVLVLAGALWKQTHDPGSEKIFTSRNFMAC